MSKFDGIFNENGRQPFGLGKPTPKFLLRPKDKQDKLPSELIQKLIDWLWDKK